MRFQPLVAAVVVVLAAVEVRADADLKPAETYAVVAGTLKWENKGIATFSPRDRKDQELYDVLAQVGVPRDNMILLLDDKATLAAIRKAIHDIGAKAKPGSTLLFYYCGHGTRIDKDKVALLNYDFAKDKMMTALDIGDWIAKDFKGERVLLLADCCMSGTLGAAATKLDKAKFKALSLTSADAGNISTANWTYTQVLIDALRGDPLLDANGDGAITLEEVNVHLAREMKYREQQRSGVAFQGLDKAFKLAVVDKDAKKPALKGAFALNDFVWAADKGTMRPGRVVGQDGNKLTVEFYNYTDKVRAAVATEGLEKVAFRTYKVGEAVAVEWDGKWWKAKVQKTEGDFHFIRYDGYGAEWDEWVLANRVAVGDVTQMRKVQVKRNDLWYPATVTKKDGDKFYVTYDGLPEKLDEWATGDRLRRAK